MDVLGRSVYPVSLYKQQQQCQSALYSVLSSTKSTSVRKEHSDMLRVIQIRSIVWSVDSKIGTESQRSLSACITRN